MLCLLSVMVETAILSQRGRGTASFHQYDMFLNIVVVPSIQNYILLAYERDGKGN